MKKILPGGTGGFALELSMSSGRGKGSQQDVANKTGARTRLVGGEITDGQRP